MGASMIRKHGTTMIELLVTMSGVAALATLALPAVQGVRESARLLSCRHNVSQLAQACINHETSLSCYPSGGWGPVWLGLPGRRGEASQPGSWVFSILPYMSENGGSALPVRRLGTGAEYQSFVAQPMPTLVCPTRRMSAALPVASTTGFRIGSGVIVQVAKATRSDYCINGGGVGSCPPLSQYPSPPPGTTATSGTFRVTICHAVAGSTSGGRTLRASQAALATHKSHASDLLGRCATCAEPVEKVMMQPSSLIQGDAWRIMPLATRAATLRDFAIPDLQDGIVHRMSRLRSTSIVDGLSNTYLLGEKNVAADTYLTGNDSGDSRPPMVGYSSDTVRWGMTAPFPDSQGISRPTSFGSPHAAGWNAAFADGSVRTLSFTIDPGLHRQLSRRADAAGRRPEE